MSKPIISQPAPSEAERPVLMPVHQRHEIATRAVEILKNSVPFIPNEAEAMARATETLEPPQPPVEQIAPTEPVVTPTVTDIDIKATRQQVAQLAKPHVKENY